MANKDFKDQVRTYEGGIVKLFAKVVTSTGGAIASQVAKGLSVAKASGEAGRYTVTLSDKYSSLSGVSVALVGATDAAYTTAAGLGWFLRNVDVASGPTFDIQFYRTDTGADAEVIDAAEFYIEVTLKNTSSF
jgi:hypothetical protein